MSGVPSFERVDYLLRANKHIEREIVFDLLRRAAARVGFSKHKYLGFGSMWFADFRFAHRLLRINDLVSIEHATYAKRANFNRPYAGINVMAGECSEVLEAIAEEEWKRPHIAWLDYDSRLDETVAAEIAFFIERCTAESVLLVTVNAYRGSYRTQNADRSKKIDTAFGFVESILGAPSIPVELDPGSTPGGAFKDIEIDAFPEFLARALLNFIARKHSLSGRQVGLNALELVPIVNLAHRDGVDMITVGVAVTTAGNRDVWRQCIIDIETAKEGADLVHRKLDLIPITIKEKLALDSCLPHDGPPASFLANVKSLGVQLSDAEIAKYRVYYRHFPVFVEVPI
jgi:hypothetical protein